MTLVHDQIADYSILVKSGFSKREAMTSQFITAIGAFVGTFLGIWIAESSGAGDSVMEKGVDLAAIVSGQGTGYLGTSVKGSDLVIPATAGGRFMAVPLFCSDTSPCLIC